MNSLNKKKDFTPTGFVGKGLNLISDRNGQNFYLVNERIYDSIKNDEKLECEELYYIENEKCLEYYRYKTKQTIDIKRGDLISVLLQ